MSTNTTEHIERMAAIEASKSMLEEIDRKLQSCASLISEAKQALSSIYDPSGPDEFGPGPSHEGLYHVVDWWRTPHLYATNMAAPIIVDP